MMKTRMTQSRSVRGGAEERQEKAQVHRHREGNRRDQTAQDSRLLSRNKGKALSMFVSGPQQSSLGEEVSSHPGMVLVLFGVDYLPLVAGHSVQSPG